MRLLPQSLSRLIEVGVPRETVPRLEAFIDLLMRWNKKINLVSSGSTGAIWDRHVLDSAQLWRLRRTDAKSWMDLGSGGGFPGLVVAIIAADERPGLHVALVESDQRKAVFLCTAARTLGLEVTVHAERIADVAAPLVDVVSARALAPLVDLIAYAKSRGSPDGIALFPKGETVHKELADASRRWRFEHRLHPSLTDPRSAVVEIGAIDGPL
jgi:16S rRNA (guanine527-N7)-methyltransferase